MSNNLHQGVTRSNESLAEVLFRCKRAAESGYRIASENVRETEKAIKKAENKIESTLAEVRELNINAPEITEDIRRQLSRVIVDLQNLQQESESRLRERRVRLSHFNISLFGRTQAGKSTLMEILTGGDGSSIGKGGQRTTRDVRTYSWRGLRITDVPGIAAFEGKKDEEAAFQAAEQADLILFLITNDGPQPAEAECLSRIKHLGKPVQGICNIKAASTHSEDLELFLLEHKKYYDSGQLRDIRREFFNMVERNSPGVDVKFVFTHLHSRFLADQPSMKAQREELLEASRFAVLEKAIIQRVRRSGELDRLKSFIDASVVPMMDFSDALLDFREQNSSSGRTFKQKRDQLEQWIKDFRQDSEQKLNEFVANAAGTLRQEIPGFAEDHYDDRGAGKAWERLMQSHDFGTKAEQLMRDIDDEAQKGIEELVRELESELSLTGDMRMERISMPEIVDTKRIFRWGTASISGALVIASASLWATPAGVPLAIAGALVGLVGTVLDFFTDSRGKKAAEARRRLSSKLERSVDEFEKGFRKRLMDWFYGELLRGSLYPIKGKLKLMISALFNLSDAQRDLADMLIERQLRLNNLLMDEVLRFVGMENWKDSFTDAARVPGYGVALLVERGVELPEEFRERVSQALGEKVIYVINTGQNRSLITQLLKRSLGSDVRVSIEEKIRVAHVPFDQNDQEGIKLAKLGQQLTGLHIMP